MLYWWWESREAPDHLEPRGPNWKQSSTWLATLLGDAIEHELDALFIAIGYAMHRVILNPRKYGCKIRAMIGSVLTAGGLDLVNSRPDDCG